MNAGSRNASTAAEPATHAGLWRLAHRCGVQPAFIDNEGVKRRASPEALMAVLGALGVPVDHPHQAEEMMRAIDAQKMQRVIEPVIVIWHGGKPKVNLTLAEEHLARPIEINLALEDGETRTWTHHALASESLDTGDSGRQSGTRITAPLPEHLPPGYHRLTVSVGNHEHESRLIVAPGQAISITDKRLFGAVPLAGLFVPLYALRSERNLGVGDLTDMRHLLDWMRTNGALVLGTLPLLATYLGHGRAPCDASPYSPVSRLFFNELYLDVDALVESPAAHESRDDAAAIRALDHVDYARVMAHKRTIIEPLARAAFDDPETLRSIERDTQADPLLGEYARFRAIVERHGPYSRNWPADLHNRLRSRALTDDDADPAAVWYHLYAQWQLKRQLSALNEPAPSRHGARREPTAALYLDLPVGVHPHGFDAWRFRDSFVENVAAGAPPDDFFTGGQNWGFAPMHPWRSREHGHECFIESIRRHLQFAGMLRIDHVMWLHRMYWLPDGFPAQEGVYVRNPAPEELYAILCLESHRNNAAVVGENLGTVPDRVNRTMERHGIHPLFVGQFSFSGAEATTEGTENIFRPVPRGALVSLNTHDTPTFAAFWRGLDIDQRVSWGLLDERDAEDEKAGRAALRSRIVAALRARGIDAEEHDPLAIATGLLEVLAGTNGAVVLATLEDFWGEQRPQNMPGTSGEHNWTRKAARPLEEVTREEAITVRLRRLADACVHRRAKRSQP